ncbi:MAG: hypothetical protein ACE5IZ_02360, partial [Dehalococcoidia bacterium]
MARYGLLTAIEKELTPFSASLASEFRQAAAAASRVLAEEDLHLWAQEGLALARYSWRSWEAASEYFRATPPVVTMLDFAGLRQWARVGRELAEVAPALSAAYFRSSPAILEHLSPAQVARWAATARHLYRGTWRSASLAVQFLDAGPVLVRQLSPGETEALARFVDTLGERSYDLASHCLAIVPHVIAPMEAADRGPFLQLALVMAQTGWADARSYLERGAALLGPIDPAQRARFLALARMLAHQDGRQTYTLFAESAKALAQVEADLHPYLLLLAEELTRPSPTAALEFLKSAPHVLERIHLDDIARWHGYGQEILAASREGGEAYFRRESSRGEEILEALSSRLELSRVGEVLRLYCKALTGADISIHPTVALTEKGIGWVSMEQPSTEGMAIYLPDAVEEHRDKSENFAIYKVYATHQAGHLEFGSFLFRFEAPGNVFPTQRLQRERQRDGRRQPLTDIERFFDLFDDRQLAADIFTATEDTRLDHLIAREYAGIRSIYRRIQERELARRPSLEEMPLRQMAVENLIRASLGGMEQVRCPQEVAPILGEAVTTLLALQRSDATVEDAAEATLRIYQLLEQIPNVVDDGMSDQQMTNGDDQQEMPPPDQQQGQEAPYQSPQPVDFRGEFKPELVQLLMRLREESQQDDDQLSPLTPEQLKALLEKSVEISIDEVNQGDLDDSIDTFLANLLKEAEAQQEKQQPQKGDQPMGPLSTPDDERELPIQPRYYYYDEWDFRAGDYKPRWCRVGEYHLGDGSVHFFDQTLMRYAALAEASRRQFEMLKPELFRKIKRLLDGEEYDLDAVIEFLVEKQAGVMPQGKVYWRRNKVERDVAVSFLLDMSASTDEEIVKRDRRYLSDDDLDDDPRRYFSWWMSRRAQDLASPPKRIIDLEKESTVLLIKALETIGDAYGIYGFSGYGRENVEFYV